MDRRNGGDPLAPPRPPKSLPRIHRPRAPEPAIMSAPLTPTRQAVTPTPTPTPTTTAAAAATTSASAPLIQPRQQPQATSQTQQLCTNNHLHHHHQPISRSNSHLQTNSNSNIINNNNNNISNNLNISGNNNNNNSNNSSISGAFNNQIQNQNNNNNNNVIQTQPQRAIITAPLIPLQLQQQQQQQHLSNNINNLSSSTTITSTNSFTRRRPPPPIINLPSLLVPSSSPSSSSASASASASSSALSSNLIVPNIQEPPVSPVTLAAPRPENERLANEYVDTPFRTTQQTQLQALLLHQTSRNQHPAGQNIHGQTTTQHNLLHSQRQQQQHHNSNSHHHQININNNNNNNSNHNSNSNNVINSGNQMSTIGIGGGSGEGGGGGGGGGGGMGSSPSPQILHSNISSHKGSNTTQTSTTHHELVAVRQLNRTLPITQPITKQPAPFSKDSLPASILHEEVDLHHMVGVGVGLGGINGGTGGIGGGGGNSTISGGIGGGNAADSLNSITCPQCKKCRCVQCQSPRQLPSRWVCNKTCLCSAETVIDYASCLCCVKALFYHCSKDHEMECDDGDSISCADDPCSCLPHKRTARWGWLGALSLALPCLWFYWPMRGCVALCAKCYARHARHGCRCNQSQIGSTSSMLPIVPIGGTNSMGTKSSGVSGGVHSGISGSGISGGGGGNSHCGSGGAGNGNGNGGGGVSRIIRTCDLTPEKRLLDTSPDY